MASVCQMTGVRVSSISNIETGKTDPERSTVSRLLACYGASLKDLESTPPTVIGLDELKQRAERASEDPYERLTRKAMLGLDTSIERDAFASRV